MVVRNSGILKMFSFCVPAYMSKPMKSRIRILGIILGPRPKTQAKILKKK